MGETTVLLEREHELEALRRLLGEARAGYGGVALIEGPAGVGKTTLIERCLEEAEDAGMRALHARAGELEASFPFGVCHQLFGDALAAADLDERSRLLAGAATHAAAVFDEEGDGAARISEDMLYPRLHGLYWLTSNLANESPLAIAVDDLQWVDAPSLRFLDFLARRADGVPIAVLVALRTGDPPVDERLLAKLRDDRLVAAMRPAHLTDAGVAELVRARIADAEDDFCLACARATGGNPLYVHELLAGPAIEDDASAASVTRASEYGVASISRNVVMRVDRLGADARGIAEAVAILGDGAPMRLAARLAGLDPEPAAELADMLAAADLVVAADDRLSFVHPIVRQSVYAEIPAARRAQEHRRAAELLGAEGASNEAVSSQLLVADRRGEAWAVAALRRSADGARSRGAAESAANYLRRALEEPPGAEDRAAVLLELGGVEMLAGDAHCVEPLREAFELADEPGMRAGAALVLAPALIYFAHTAEGATVARTALEELGEDPPWLRTILRTVMIGTALVDLECRVLVADELAEARRQAHEMDPATEGPLMAILAFDALCDAPADEAAELALRAIRDGHLLDQFTPDHPAVMFSIGTLLATGHDAEAQPFLAKAADVAAASGSVRAYATVCTLRSRGAFRRGDITEALADAEATLQLTYEHGRTTGLPIAVAALMDPLIERGELEAAEAAMDRLDHETEDTESHGFQQVREGRARLRIGRGRIAEALEDARACGRWEREWGASNSIFSHYPWRVTAALAHLAAGDRESARELCEEELELARTFGDPRVIGITLRVAGLAEEGERRLELLTEASEVLEGTPARLDHAKALVDLGAALRVANRRREARGPLAQALEIAHRCGGTVVADRAHEELIASGARPRRRERSGAESLTPSERRAAEMAAEGLSNPEIAQALFVTRKTIEMHLSRAYGKLGISGRDEIAAALGKPGSGQAAARAA